MAAITALVAPSGECYEVKAVMMSLQCNIPERLRGELLTMGRYTNPASFTFTLVYVVYCVCVVCII